MKPNLLILLVMAAMICAQDTTAQFRKKQQKTSNNFVLHTLAPGVWAAVANDQFGRAICNAGIIDLGDKTLVFDPFMNPTAARELREAAESLTGRMVSIVVNSHYHNDHIRGNQVFSPDASIISSNFTRKEILRVEPAEQEWEMKHASTLLKAMRKRMSSSNSIEKEELPLWIGYYEGMVESSDELKMTLPDIVFDDSLWIMGSKRNIKILECKNGHTKSDAVLMLPDDGIIFMGDLLYADRHPWISDGNPVDWQQSLKTLYEDPLYEVYVPGHGPVSKKPALQTLYQYLGTVNDLCKSANNDSLQTILMQQPIPQPYQHWYFGRFYQPNLQYLITRNKE